MALSQLLSDNRSGALRQQGRAYRLSLPGDRGEITYSPLLWNLKRCFYSHTARRRRRKKGNSSRQLGSRFHRHVRHFNECSRGHCDCKARFGTGIGRPRSGSPLQQALLQREAFLLDYELTPFASEIVVSSDRLNLATAVDELAWQKPSSQGSKKRLVLISWKTGYSVGARRSRSKKGSSSKMMGSSLSHVVNSEEGQHQLQLLAEDRLLRENGVTPDLAVIVYVLRERDYYVERLREDGFWASEDTASACWQEFSDFCCQHIKRRHKKNRVK